MTHFLNPRNLPLCCVQGLVRYLSFLLASKLAAGGWEALGASEDHHSLTPPVSSTPAPSPAVIVADAASTPLPTSPPDTSTFAATSPPPADGSLPVAIQPTVDSATAVPSAPTVTSTPPLSSPPALQAATREAPSGLTPPEAPAPPQGLPRMDTTIVSTSDSTLPQAPAPPRGLHWMDTTIVSISDSVYDEISASLQSKGSRSGDAISSRESSPDGDVGQGAAPAQNKASVPGNAGPVEAGPAGDASPGEASHAGLCPEADPSSQSLEAIPSMRGSSYPLPDAETVGQVAADTQIMMASPPSASTPSMSSPSASPPSASPSSLLRGRAAAGIAAVGGAAAAAMTLVLGGATSLGLGGLAGGVAGVGGVGAGAVGLGAGASATGSALGAAVPAAAVVGEVVAAASGGGVMMATAAGLLALGGAAAAAKGAASLHERQGVEAAQKLERQAAAEQLEQVGRGRGSGWCRHLVCKLCCRAVHVPQFSHSLRSFIIWLYHCSLEPLS